MAFTTVSIDPHHIETAPGAWQHWVVNSTGVKRYLFAYNTGSGAFSLYRSTDSGGTWAAIDVGNYPGTISDNAILQTQLIIGGGTGDDLILTSVVDAHSGTNIIDFCEFDVGALAWSAITNIGGSFNQNTHPSLAATQCASVQRFRRQDGTEIVIYQAETLDINVNLDNIRRVRILKLSGATWTQLAQFAAGVYTGPSFGDGSSTHYVLWSAVTDGCENVHVFMNRAFVPFPDGGDFYTTTNLIHVSVAAADDAVSSEHTVDTDLEQMPAATNPAQPTASTENGRAAVNAASTEIAFGYGWQTNTFPAGAGAHVHVARGDLTGDILNPTWAVDDIATNEPKWNNGASNDVSVTYDNPAKIALEYFGGGLTTVGYGEHALANLKVYWATEGGSSKGKIRFSQFDGVSAWTAAAQLWPDPDSSAVSLDGFDVFSNASTVCPATITIACPVAPLTAQVGVPYASDAPVVSGDTPPDTFVLLTAPLWMTINALTGVVSGTPTAEGLVTYTIQVTDSLGNIAVVSAPCPLTVSNPIPPPPVCEQVPATGPETLVLYNEPLEQQGT